MIHAELTLSVETTNYELRLHETDPPPFSLQYLPAAVLS